jgi:hypothetical protein
MRATVGYLAFVIFFPIVEEAYSSIGLPLPSQGFSERKSISRLLRQTVAQENLAPTCKCRICYFSSVIAIVDLYRNQGNVFLGCFAMKVGRTD